MNKIEVLPSSVNLFGKKYDCEVMGKDKIDHFGPYTSSKGIKYESPVVNVFCQNGIRNWSSIKFNVKEFKLPSIKSRY